MNTHIHTHCSRAILALFAALLALPAAADSSPAQGPKQAAIEFTSPDPVAIMDPEGKGLYVFATGPGVSIFYSSNFLDWERVGRVFPEDTYPEGMPAWAKKKNPKSTTSLWAPDIVFHNGKYYLYYSISSLGSQLSAIGLATNKSLDPKSPDYKWVDEGMVLESSPKENDYNAIDPALFIDDDGKAYLYWGSYWSGLKVVEVDPKTGKPFRYKKGKLKVPEGYFPVASRPERSIEAPFVIRRENYYYLFVSWGSTLSSNITYRIAVGRAVDPLGPFLDKNGKCMDLGGGTLIFAGSDKWKGPGHNGFFRTYKEGKNKGDWILFHTNNPENRRSRHTQIRPVYWDDAGWPVVGELLDVPFEQFDFSAGRTKALEQASRK